MQIRVTQTTYTLPKGNRIVTAGLYPSSDFSKDEVAFMKNLGSAKEVASPTPPKKEVSTPKKVESKN
jgi:hypothetical protein